MNVQNMTADDFVEIVLREYEKREKEQQKEPDVFIRREIQELTGLSEKRALSFMKDLMNDDIAEPVFTSRADAWGRVQPNIPAIRIKMEAINVSLRDSS